MTGASMGTRRTLSVDPDSELIDEVAVTAANTADHAAADDLLAPMADLPPTNRPFRRIPPTPMATPWPAWNATAMQVMARVPAAHGQDGRYSKDDFGIDLEAGTVSCPAGQTPPSAGGP